MCGEGGTGRGGEGRRESGWDKSGKGEIRRGKMGGNEGVRARVVACEVMISN